jgi:O-antigen/teichoic acid export membrane protein
MVDTCPTKADEAPPIQRLSLRANFVWSLLGNVVYAACQWGILVVLAKFGSPVLVGEFALALAVTAPVMIFASLSLRNVQATDARGEYEFADYLSLRGVATALAMVVIAVLAVSGYPAHLALVIVLIGLAKGIEFISDIALGFMQQREQMDRIALSMIVKGVLSLGGFAAAIITTGDLVIASAALAAVWALVLVGYDLRVAARMNGDSLRRLLVPRWQTAVLWKLTLLALPGGIVMTLISFGGNVPRYFIEQQLGTRELGIFAALTYPIFAGSTVVAALGQSATPRLAQHYANGEYAEFQRLLGRLVLIGLGLGVAGLALIRVAGAFVLELLYQPEYAAYVTEFLWIGLASSLAFVASFLGYGMTAARYFRAQVPIFAAALLAIAAACALLVPRYGLVGAALATAVGTVVQAIGSVIVIRHALSRGRHP